MLYSSKSSYRQSAHKKILFRHSGLHSCRSSLCNRPVSARKRGTGCVVTSHLGGTQVNAYLIGVLPAWQSMFSYVNKFHWCSRPGVVSTSPLTDLLVHFNSLHCSRRIHSPLTALLVQFSSLQSPYPQPPYGSLSSIHFTAVAVSTAPLRLS